MVTTYCKNDKNGLLSDKGTPLTEADNPNISSPEGNRTPI